MLRVLVGVYLARLGLTLPQRDTVRAVLNSSKEVFVPSANLTFVLRALLTDIARLRLGFPFGTSVGVRERTSSHRYLVGNYLASLFAVVKPTPPVPTNITWSP